MNFIVLFLCTVLLIMSYEAAMAISKDLNNVLTEIELQFHFFNYLKKGE